MISLNFSRMVQGVTSSTFFSGSHRPVSRRDLSVFASHGKRSDTEKGNKKEEDGDLHSSSVLYSSLTKKEEEWWERMGSPGGRPRQQVFTSRFSNTSFMTIVSPDTLLHHLEQIFGPYYDRRNDKRVLRSSTHDFIRRERGKTEEGNTIPLPQGRKPAFCRPHQRESARCHASSSSADGRAGMLASSTRRCCWETDIILVRCQHYVPVLQDVQQEGTEMKEGIPLRHTRSDAISMPRTTSLPPPLSTGVAFLLSQLRLHLPSLNDDITARSWRAAQAPTREAMTPLKKKSPERGTGRPRTAWTGSFKESVSTGISSSSDNARAALFSDHASSSSLGECSLTKWWQEQTIVEEFSTLPSFDIYLRTPCRAATSVEVGEEGENTTTRRSKGKEVKKRRRLSTFRYPCFSLMEEKKEEWSPRDPRQKREGWDTWQRVGLFHAIPSLPLPRCNTRCQQWVSTTPFCTAPNPKPTTGKKAEEEETTRRKGEEERAIEKGKQYRGSKDACSVTAPTWDPEGLLRLAAPTSPPSSHPPPGATSPCRPARAMAIMRGTVLSLGDLLRFLGLLPESEAKSETRETRSVWGHASAHCKLVDHRQEEGNKESKEIVRRWQNMADPRPVGNGSWREGGGVAAPLSHNECHSTSSCFCFTPPPDPTGTWNTVRHVQDIVHRRHAYFHAWRAAVEEPPGPPSEKGEDAKKEEMWMDRAPQRKAQEKSPAPLQNVKEEGMKTLMAVPPCQMAMEWNHRFSLPPGCTLCPPPLTTCTDLVSLSTLYRIMQPSHEKEWNHRTGRTFSDHPERVKEPPPIVMMDSGCPTHADSETERVVPQKGYQSPLFSRPPPSRTGQDVLTTRYKMHDGTRSLHVGPPRPRCLAKRNEPHDIPMARTREEGGVDPEEMGKREEKRKNRAVSVLLLQPPPLSSISSTASSFSFHCTRSSTKMKSRRSALDGRRSGDGESIATPPSPVTGVICGSPSPSAWGPTPVRRWGSSLFFCMLSYTPLVCPAFFLRSSSSLSPSSLFIPTPSLETHSCGTPLRMADGHSTKSKGNVDGLQEKRARPPFLPRHGALPSEGNRSHEGILLQNHERCGSYEGRAPFTCKSKTYHAFLHFPSEAPLVMWEETERKVETRDKKKRCRTKRECDEARGSERKQRGASTVQDEQGQEETEEKQKEEEAKRKGEREGASPPKTTTHTLWVYVAPELQSFLREGVLGFPSPSHIPFLNAKGIAKQRSAPHANQEIPSGISSSYGMDPSMLDPFPDAHLSYAAPPTCSRIRGTAAQKDHCHAYWSQQLLKCYLSSAKDVTTPNKANDLCKRTEETVCMQAEAQRLSSQDITLVVSQLPPPSLLLRNPRWRREPYTFAEEMKYGAIEQISGVIPGSSTEN